MTVARREPREARGEGWVNDAEGGVTRNRRLGRPSFTVALTAALSLVAMAAHAAPRRGPELRAKVDGVTERALRAEIERAIGEERGPPANRIVARRRASQAADNAIALLRSEGYYDYTVEPDVTGADDKPQPIIHVDPGVRTHIGKTAVGWQGAPPDAGAQAAALKAVALTPGAPARAVDVLAAQGRVVAALQARGYADAKAVPVAPIVDHADQSMDATFTVAAGGPVRLDGVELKGKTRTDPRSIRSLAPWKSGDVYKPSDVAQLERRLTDTGVYDSATVALAAAPNAEGLRPVVVSLADRTKHSFSLSAGYSTTEGPDVNGTYSIYNVIDRADTLTFLARAQTIDSRLGVTLSIPNFWGPSQTLRFGPDAFNEVTNAYTTTGAEFVVDLTQRYDRTTTFFTKGFSVVASRIDDKELGDLDILAVRPLAELSLDHTDNTLDAHHGWKIDTRGEPIGVFGEETLFYLKFQAQASTYRPVGFDTIAAFRLQAGSIIGGKIPQVPASDRFFAGGGGTVRGYVYQNVGPHYADNTPQGGLSLVDATVELRRPLFGEVGGVLFLDSGAVGTQSTPSFTHIASSVGIGLRYNLGFAPLRADFAFPVNRLSAASQPPIQVYLGIGQSF